MTLKKQAPHRDMAAEARLGELSEMRLAILSVIKGRSAASISEVAQVLGVSYEAIRQQIGQLRREKWIERRRESVERRGVGRPRAMYQLTPAGDHLFPKQYDALTIELIDAIVERQGISGLRSILQYLTDTRVKSWAPRLKGLDLRQRIEALRGIYLAEDPFIRVDDEGGELRLIEHNCPFLSVARERPALCSLTVSTLARLLGFRVVREAKFQEGDGRCVFRVQQDQPVSAEGYFELEGV